MIKFSHRIVCVPVESSGPGGIPLSEYESMVQLARAELDEVAKEIAQFERDMVELGKVIREEP